MRHNPTIQNAALHLFTGLGAVSTPRDVTGYLNFGINIEYFGAAPLAAAVTFNIIQYDALLADPCKPDLATGTPVQTVPVCLGAVGSNAQFTIPAGTKPGAICGVALTCSGKKFVGITLASGNDDEMRLTALLTGKIGHA